MKLPTMRKPSAKRSASKTVPPVFQRKRAVRLPVTAPRRGALFPIVGVGASAGGLEAFQELLKHLPADTGMGFVLVHHLDPLHESALVQLLARSTTMPVTEVTHDLRVLPNRVYVIPPNAHLAIAGGVLKLTQRGNERGASHSIDFFFEALAKDQRERAIGVVLSGTASDGTLGLEAIRVEGGVTFAQNESARYDSMPRSAVAAGCVDFVLSPEAIAGELARVAQHPFVLHAPGESPREPARASGRRDRQNGATTEAAAGDAAEAEPDGFTKVLQLLRNHSGVDFSLYKPSTIQRRVARRLVLNKHETLAAYATFLKGNEKELSALYSDVLISVTSFFRNPDAFAFLKRMIFPKLLAQLGRDETMRFWVQGCSTGQEAYSLAMLFAESAADSPRVPPLQIFATDLNEEMLAKARAGLYAKPLLKDVSPERLRRFFREEEGGYRVSKELREQVVFARQNLMTDAPFSRLDLISCRNVLIYLEPTLQKRIMPAFHYALKLGGFLFLGASESVGSFTELFGPADKKQKIFQRKAATPPAFRLMPPGGRTAPTSTGPRPTSPTTRAEPAVDGPRSESSAQREADRITVSQFAPPGVLINSELQILQFRGATSAYLEPPVGQTSFNVLKMAREGLLLPLRAAINKAKRENKLVRREGVSVRHDGGTRTMTLQVTPLQNLKEPCFLILFGDGIEPIARRTGPRPAPTQPVGRKAVASRVAELERELAETRAYLQSIQGQNESANEELQATSEAGQSANEELQSINEELETSKEELESTNEELTTVNDEMVSRNMELSRLNADLNNLQVNIHTAILLLSRDLTIRRFTAPAERIFNLLATDVGRSFGAIRHNLDAPDLERLLAEVMDAVSLREREVRDKDGRWYALRARPYMTLDNKIDGVVLVLSDIDSLKRTEREIEAARAESVLRTAPVPFLVLRADLRVNTASDAFYENFGVTPAATEGRLIYEIGNGQWNIPKLRELLEEIIPQKTIFNRFEVTHQFPIIGTRTMLLNARRVDNAEGVPERVLLTIEDITGRKASEEALRASEERFRVAALAVSNLIWTNNIQGMMEGEQPGWAQFTGQTPEEYQGYGWARAVHPDDAQPTIEAWNAAVAENRQFEFEHRVRRHDGAWRSCSIRAVPVIGGDGEIREWVGVHNDITERKQAEEALRKSEARYRTLFDSMDEGFCMIEPLFDENDTPHDYRFLEVNPAFEKQSGLTQVVGRTLKELVPGIERYWIETYGEVALTGQPVHVENYVAEMNRWFDVNALRVGESASRRVVCLFTDISERKNAEAALVQEKARTENILFSITDAFLTLDREWRFTYFNARAAEIFETVNVSAAVLGKNLWEVFPALVGSIVEREYHRAMDERVSVIFENHYQLERWFEVTAYPSADGISVLFRNITERKDTERRNEFLAAFPQKLAGATTEADIVRITVEAVGSHLKVDRCYFVERHAQENRLTLSHNWLRGPSPSLEGDYDLRDFGDLEWWRQYSGGASPIDDVSSKSYGVEDVKTDPFTQGKISSYDAVGIGAYAVQPFRREGERAVCLAITEAFSRKWTAYEMHILDDVVARVWPLVERARGARALHEVEERRRLALDGAELGSWNLNLETMRLVTDARFQTIFGCAAELNYEGVIAITHPGDLARVQAAIAVATRLVDPAPYAIEYRVVHPDGAVRWVFAQGRANFRLVGAERKLMSFDGTVADITERKQAVEALHESEARFRALVTASSDVVYEMSADWSEMRRLEGRDFIADTEKPSRTWFEEYIAPEDQPQVMAAIQQAIRAKGIFELEHRIRRVDGTLGWTFSRAVPLLDAQGEIVKWFGAASDITQRKEAEEALRASAEFNRNIIESSRDCVKILDLEGRLLAMSEGGQRQLCIPDIAPLLGSSWIKFWVGAEDRTAAQGAVLEAAAGGIGNFTGVYATLGVPRWWDVVVTPMLDARGEAEKLLAISREVTERVLSEQSSKAAAEELARSSRAKDDFLAALSHELRTPLTPVLMTATALESDLSLSLEVRDQLGMMRRNVELEARLIDDLLDLTRISRGKLTIAAISADLHELLEHTAQIVRSDGLGKQVRIVFKLDAKRHHALADPTRMQQVFWNLLKNSLKFTPTGGTITVSTCNDDEAWLLISVADTGIGIGEEALPSVFNAFEQGDVAGQHRYGGLGLGLAISQAIVKMHGGLIRAKSEGMGRGATFTVALATIDPVIPSEQAGKAKPATSRALRLLVVEDHEATRTVLNRLLTRTGYQVVTAGNMQEALTAFSAERFDAVISDLGLPDGSGLDLMRQIQRQRTVPGIALSGYGMEEDLRQTKEAGFFAHLVKPVNLDQLRQVLSQLGEQM